MRIGKRKNCSTSVILSVQLLIEAARKLKFDRELSKKN